MPQISILPFGGAGEIGGNKFFLQDGQARLFLDFGIAFGRLGMYYDVLLKPRSFRGVRDLLLMGLIPPVEGLYRKDLILDDTWARAKNIPEYRLLALRENRPIVDAVLVSHAHIDHIGDIAYLDEQIPIVCTKESAFIARCMQVTGAGTLEQDYCYINPRINNEGFLSTIRSGSYKLRPHIFLDGSLSAEGTSFWETAGAGARKSMDRAPVSAFQGTIGGLEIKWWPVDHSIPGAVGYAIHTSAGWIGYTGDIRFSGQNSAATELFMNELAALNLRILLCEGTHLETSRTPITEKDVQDRSIDILKGYRGKLAVADFGPRNIERLQVFINVARTTKRVLLLQPKDIYIIQGLHLANSTKYPDPLSIAEIALFNDPKSTMDSWEKELRTAFSSKIVGAKQISSNPGEYILALSLWDLPDLPDFEGIQGGAYLFSNSGAYDDEQKADLDRLRNWVKWLKVDLIGDPEDNHAVQLHVSGHADGTELENFVKTVTPENLIPIHTENADVWIDKLKGSKINLIIPEYGKEILFESKIMGT